MELLDVLGMMKYHEMFAEQSIDGEVLVECDEPTLQHELGMDSKVDRIRHHLRTVLCPWCSETRVSICASLIL